MSSLLCGVALSQIIASGTPVSSGCKRPDFEKIKAIQEIKPARTKKEVRKLLGLFGYFRDHIPNYAALAKPIILT